MADFKFIDLLDSLPPCIARKSVERLLGGAIKSSTLANEDWRGTGPSVKSRLGRCVIYETRSLLEWLDSRNQ